jgi:hypothetical protein
MEAGPIMATTLSPSLKPPRDNRGESSARPLQALGLFIEPVMENGRRYGGDAANRRCEHGRGNACRFSPALS